jgi:hypothetical protein
MAPGRDPAEEMSVRMVAVEDYARSLLGTLSQYVLSLIPGLLGAVARCSARNAGSAGPVYRHALWWLPAAPISVRHPPGGRRVQTHSDQYLPHTARFLIPSP